MCKHIHFSFFFETELTHFSFFFETGLTHFSMCIYLHVFIY
jgi:hypothetical protein